MLMSSTNKHMAEQTPSYIMQRACFIIFMNHVGGMAFITLPQEIPQGAGGTPADKPVSPPRLKSLIRQSLLLERGPPVRFRSLRAELMHPPILSSIQKLEHLRDKGTDIASRCVE